MLSKQYKQKYLTTSSNPVDTKMQNIQKIDTPLITNLLCNVEKLSELSKNETEVSKAIKLLRIRHDTPDKLNSAISKFLSRIWR